MQLHFIWALRGVFRAPTKLAMRLHSTSEIIIFSHPRIENDARREQVRPTLNKLSKTNKTFAQGNIVYQGAHAYFANRQNGEDTFLSFSYSM